VVDDGHELGEALRRAAERHGVRLRQGQPGRAVLTAAIREYRALFRPDSADRLQAQRRFALEAMDAFSDFAPRLAGPLVEGDGPLDLVRLLVYADTPETVALTLTDRHIPWRPADTTLLHGAGQRRAHPAFRFLAGDSRVEIVVLNESDRRDPPRDPLSAARLPTLDRKELAERIETS
jgi:hypothetical protein